MGSICLNKKNEDANNEMYHEELDVPTNSNRNNTQNETNLKSKKKYFENIENVNQETNIQNFSNFELEGNKEDYKLKSGNEIKNEYKENNNNNEGKDGNNFDEETGFFQKKVNINIKSQKEEKRQSIQRDLLPSDDFSKYIFIQLNKLRKDPKSFIPLIKESKSKILKDKYNRLIYKSKVKVALGKGEETFDEAIEFLEKTKPLEELIFCPDMVIPVPESEEEIKDKTYLKNKINEINKKGIKIGSFWKDSIKDPETCFILLIVDDNLKNPGKKRQDLLNPQYKYIGISSVLINKSFVCYITLSNN